MRPLKRSNAGRVFPSSVAVIVGLRFLDLARNDNGGQSKGEEISPCALLSRNDKGAFEMTKGERS